MRRWHALLMLVGVVGIASAAPLPRERDDDKIMRLFGQKVDPAKDSRFQLNEGRLSIRTGETPHLIAPNATDGPSAPRTARTVEGDFTAEVRIHFPFPTDLDPKRAANNEMIGLVGLYLANSPTELVVHGWSLHDQQGNFRRAGKHDGYLQGRGQFGGSSAGGAFDNKSTYFRITRTGNIIKFAARANVNDNWHEFNVPNANFGQRLTVGVFVSNPGTLPIQAEFEEFRVTPVPAAEKP